jgi:large subunit ribosomal protein L10
MPSAAKKEALAQIKSDFQAADAVWVVDYRGLSVKEAENLRGAIRNQDASMKVYKNSLTEIALKELELPALAEVLEGPSAFVFVSGDPVASAKALKTFAKSNPKLELKGGLLDGAVMSRTQIEAIADLPSREQLIAKLLGTIRNPLSSVVSVLNEVPAKLVRTIGAIADKAA